MSDGDIDLATLWIPVAAETSKIKGQLRQAGLEGAREFNDALGRAIDPSLFQKRLQQSIQNDAIRGAIKDFKKSLEPEPGRWDGMGEKLGHGFIQGFQRTGVAEKISGAFGGIELGAIGAASGIAGIVIAAGKLTEALVEVGEDFEDIERSVVLFTGETGPALQELQEHATKLVASLDTSTKNLGSDMAILSTRLKMEASPALDQLTRHVEELSDRFGRINPDAFAGAMMRFGLSGKAADDALASLMKSAQELGVNLPANINTLSTSGAVLHDLGLSAEQAGFFIAKLQQLGPAGAGGVEILQKAMKEAGKEGKTLKDFLQEESDFLNGPATDAAKDAEAADVFGAKKWEEARDALKAYHDTMEETPDHLKGTSRDIDHVIDQTQSLRNKWDLFRNELSVKIEPFAGGLLDDLNRLLDGLNYLLAPPQGPATGDMGGALGLDGDTPGVLPGAAPSIPGLNLPGLPGVGVGPRASVGPGSNPFVLPGGDQHRVGGKRHPGSGVDWDALAGGEAGGNWSINTGNGFFGGLQFDAATWAQYGGTSFAPRPDLATKDQQIQVAETALAARGGPSSLWPANSAAHPDWFGGGANVGGGGLNLSTIPIAAQKYANDCIDASARIILSHAGINMSEDQLKSVIAPGGTIGSQAAGLNRLNPAGGYVAMAGSGGSQQAMFAAIKASIDNGTGSILNVAPGSSIAGTPFSEGHFIAATGYNADGTINLSDTARGTQYTVSADDAFQATRGRGIVAGTGRGPAGFSALGYGTGGRTGPGGSPYVPGTGETQAEARQRQRAVEDAQQRQEEADDRVRDLQSQQEEQRKKLGADQAKLPGLGPVESAAQQAEIAKDNKELERTQKELTKALRDQKRSSEDLTEAQTRQQEEASKAPPGSGEGRGRGGDDKYGGMASQLSSGLLKGFGEELGFGDIFGKAPWDWGIVKLMTGLAGFGIGTANAWSDEIGKGNTSVTGYQPLAGFGGGSGGGGGGMPGGGGSSGLGATLAGQMPPAVKLAWQASKGNMGPSPVAGVPSPIAANAHGATQPASYSIDNSTHIFGNTMSDPEQLARPIKEINNAGTYGRASFGGTPMTSGPGGG